MPFPTCCCRGFPDGLTLLRECIAGGRITWPMQLPPCKCLLARPGVTKCDEKLPGAQVVWGVGGVHRAASHPASDLWDGAPERGRGCPGGGQSPVPVGAASVVSPRGSTAHSWHQAFGRGDGDTQALQRLLGRLAKGRQLRGPPSLGRMGVPQQQRLEAYCCRQQREGVFFTY